MSNSENPIVSELNRLFYDEKFKKHILKLPTLEHTEMDGKIVALNGKIRCIRYCDSETFHVFKHTEKAVLGKNKEEYYNIYALIVSQKIGTILLYSMTYPETRHVHQTVESVIVYTEKGWVKVPINYPL